VKFASLRICERDIYGAFPELSKDQPEEEYRRLGEILADREMTVEDVETHEHFLDRITRGFDEVHKSNYDTVAVVTHGGPIRCFVREILKLGELKRIGNGSIIELEVDVTGSGIVSMQGVE
jgi:broad specificity phosphatase PhoE